MRIREESTESAEEELGLLWGLGGLGWGLGFLCCLVGFLGKEDWVDVGKDSSVGYGHAS